jgi:hypothetical protein
MDFQGHGRAFRQKIRMMVPEKMTKPGATINPESIMAGMLIVCFGQGITPGQFEIV